MPAETVQTKLSSAPQEPTSDSSKTPGTLWYLMRHRLLGSQPSPLSITLKWSLYISGLIVLGMGLLAWIVIAQQNRTHLEQMAIYGQALAEQLSQAAAEPLMADDSFTLEVLVSHIGKSNQVLGAAVYRQGTAIATAGLSPQAAATTRIPGPKDLFRNEVVRLAWSWQEESGQPRNALSFFTPMLFQDVTAGHAQITLDRDILAEGRRRSVQAIAVITALLIFLTVAMAFALGRQLGRPIQDLAAAGQALKDGKPAQRLFAQSNDEIGLIIESFNQMAADISDKQRVEEAFSRYVSPSVAQNVLTNMEQPVLGGIAMEGSVLFCDIVGYTELSETMDLTDVAEMLNEYFSYISLAGHTCQGTVDKFIGDCVMVVFGVPDEDSHHALHAVTCAVLIQEVVGRINRQREKRRLQPVFFRIGVNSGAMLAGNMGAPERMQFTVVGDTVNLASRLCGQAQSSQIIISGETAEQPGMREAVVLQEHLPILVKGRRQSVTPVEVLGFNAAHQRHIEKVVGGLFPTGENG